MRSRVREARLRLAKRYALAFVVSSSLEHRFSNQEKSLIERETEVWGVWSVWGEGRDPSGGNGGSNKTGLTSDTNSSITESPHPGAAPSGRADPSGRASQAQAQARRAQCLASLRRASRTRDRI